MLYTAFKSIVCLPTLGSGLQLPIRTIDTLLQSTTLAPYTFFVVQIHVDIPEKEIMVPCTAMTLTLTSGV